MVDAIGARPIDARLSACRKHELIVSLLLAFISLWLLATANRIIIIYFGHASLRNGIWASVPLGAACLFATLFSRVRYNDFVPLLRLSLKSSALGLLAYLILEPPDFTVAFSDAESRAKYIRIAYFVSIALSGLSVRVPAFTAPAAVYILSTRYLVESISGWRAPNLDIGYMLDMALYLALFAVPTIAIGPKVHPFFKDDARQSELTCVAFGLHLGNYFWSGIAKLLVGPHLWTWILENRTFNSIPWAIEYGMSPIGHMPHVVSFVSDTLQVFVVPLNLSIVLFQLFAIVCVFRMSWLKLASLFYDFLHLGIWLFSGLFFWPWVWNNFTILLAARAERSPLGLSAKLACVITILLGYPSLPFHQAAWLAWFDVLDARDTYFEAVTKDGRAIRVPAAFFLGHGYSEGAGYMDTIPHQGQYDFTFWGSTYSYDRQLSSGTCPPPPSVAKGTLESPEQRAARLSRIALFIQAHHSKMLSRELIFGKDSYYFRSNHYLSNPYLFDEFNKLSVNEIVSYNLVADSICLSLIDGTLRKRSVAHLVESFNVR
jgi:hypothetical protein